MISDGGRVVKVVPHSIKQEKNNAEIHRKRIEAQDKFETGQGEK